MKPSLRVYFVTHGPQGHAFLYYRRESAAAGSASTLRAAPARYQRRGTNPRDAVTNCRRGGTTPPRARPPALSACPWTHAVRHCMSREAWPKALSPSRTAGFTAASA